MPDLYELPTNGDAPNKKVRWEVRWPVWMNPGAKIIISRLILVASQAESKWNEVEDSSTDEFEIRPKTAQVPCYGYAHLIDLCFMCTDSFLYVPCSYLSICVDIDMWIFSE